MHSPHVLFQNIPLYITPWLAMVPPLVTLLGEEEVPHKKSQKHNQFQVRLVHLVPSCPLCSSVTAHLVVQPNWWW
uniref:Uncharacterized protein n=1 Tax=Octopus bimaculoides TaxID=37653 RepID=A0A0L8FKP2_OCTBM